MKNYAYQGRCSASVTLGNPPRSEDPHSSQYTKAEFGSYFMIHPKISKFQTSLPPCRLSSKLNNYLFLCTVSEFPCRYSSTSIKEYSVLRILAFCHLFEVSNFTISSSDSRELFFSWVLHWFQGVCGCIIDTVILWYRFHYSPNLVNDNLRIKASTKRRNILNEK